MRVLHINSSIAVNSGVMSVLMNYYRNIDRDRVQFDFAYYPVSRFSHVTYEDEICDMGGRVYKLADPRKIVKFNDELGKLIRNELYKTVHIHDPFLVNIVYYTLRKCNVKNIIVHSHATKWSDKRFSSVRNRLFCVNLTKHADYLFACSRAAGDFLYGERSRYYIMNNAIELDRYSFRQDVRDRMRQELFVDDRIVFGHVGNICAQKNHAFLINVYKEIRRLNKKTMLIIVGDGGLREELESLIQSNDLENDVYLLGARSNVEDYYQAMDCMIFPSLYEGLPMVGVEAQCSGLSVLFSDSVTREVGADYSDYMSLAESKSSWAKKALQLAAQPLNREKGKETMAKLGFDIHEQAKKVENLYLGMNGPVGALYTEEN